MEILGGGPLAGSLPFLHFAIRLARVIHKPRNVPLLRCIHHITTFQLNPISWEFRRPLLHPILIFRLPYHLANIFTHVLTSHNVHCGANASASIRCFKGLQLEDGLVVLDASIRAMCVEFAYELCAFGTKFAMRTFGVRGARVVQRAGAWFGIWDSAWLIDVHV